MLTARVLERFYERAARAFLCADLFSPGLSSAILTLPESGKGYSSGHLLPLHKLRSCLASRRSKAVPATRLVDGGLTCCLRWLAERQHLSHKCLG